MGDDSALHRFGEALYDHQRAVLSLGILSVLLSGILISGGSSFIDGNNPPPKSESGRALELVSEELPVVDSNVVTYLFSHETMAWSAPEYERAVEAALQPLLDSSIGIMGVSSVYQNPQDPHAIAQHVSNDGLSTAVFVTIDGSEDEVRGHVDQLRVIVDSGDLEIWVTGSLIINDDFDKLLKDDTVRAEIFGIPLSLVILVFVFATLVAASLPMLTAGLMFVSSLGFTYWFSDKGVLDLTQWTVSMVSLIGIAVTIDYSLFIVSRFKEELSNGSSERDAVAKMMDTAGRAVLYSGATVAVGLCSLFYFNATHMPSMGFGGAVAVAFALIYSLTVLPAILCMLGDRVNDLRVPVPETWSREGFWRDFATKVMDRPWSWLAPSVLLLLLLGAPSLSAEFNAGGIGTLPPDLESRMAYEELEREFPAFQASSMPVVVVLGDGQDPFDAGLVSSISEFCVEVEFLDGVISANSPYCTPELFVAPLSDWPAEAQEAWASTRSDTLVMISVATQYNSSSDGSEKLVRSIRSVASDSNQEILVGGWSGYEVDMRDHLVERVPTVVALVLTLTMLLIWFQVRSVLVPIKAVVMNIFSIAASYGLVVLVFQEGFMGLDEVMNFTAQPIDYMVPPLLFGIAFGLSMDYEVLMLSRIHEAWIETGDNTRAVSEGLQASGGLITGAAAIMVAVFSGFILADVMIIKSLGFALAVAVLIDATIVRAIVVPSAMRLMGEANWWSPSLPFTGKDKGGAETAR